MFKQFVPEQIIQSQRYCDRASDHRASLAMPQRFDGNSTPCFAQTGPRTLKTQGTTGQSSGIPAIFQEWNVIIFYIFAPHQKTCTNPIRQSARPKERKNCASFCGFKYFETLIWCFTHWISAVQTCNSTKGTRVQFPASWSYPPLIVDERQQLQVAQIQKCKHFFFNMLHVHVCFFTSYMPKQE